MRARRSDHRALFYDFLSLCFHLPEQLSQMQQYLHVLLHGGDGDVLEAAVGVLVARGQVGAG